MPHLLFFPDGSGQAGSLWAWIWYGLLLVATVAAAVTDYRTGRIPNYLTVTLFALGLAMNAIRGGLLASAGHQVWLWPEPSVTVGVVDGLLFSLAGFGLAFAVFLVQWILGVCGGGDLKLFAALGAWVGSSWSIFLLLGTLVCVMCIVLVRGAGRVLAGKPVRFQTPPKSHKQTGNADADRANRRKARLTDTIYAPSMALSVALVLLWLWRVEMGLAPPESQRGAQDRVSLAR